MQKILLIFVLVMSFTTVPAYTHGRIFESKVNYKDTTLDSRSTKNALQSYTYKENFEDGELGAWASYPLWQDNAYDQKFKVGNIVPGNSNLSLIQKVIAYSHVDNYAGAQKLLDMYLVPGATISFKYYLKTNEQTKFLKIRFAAGKYGKIDLTLPNPKTNKWVKVTIDYKDFADENPLIAEKKKVRIYALAFLAKIPKADPAMPIYLGLDDIKFKGARLTPFQFTNPGMYKLPEFKPYIPKEHYVKNDTLNLRGRWPVGAKKVKLKISSYTNNKKTIYKEKLTKRDELWTLKPLKLSFPEGLYLGRLIAYEDDKKLSETEFTIHIAPKNMANKHPRLLFNADRKKWIERRFGEKRFQPVLNSIIQNAEIEREQNPVNDLVYDLDQFPDKNWLPSWNAFGLHIYSTGDALKYNALAYTFNNDHKAGEYAKNMLVKLSGWPEWISPWLIRRGRYSEHRLGTWSTSVALAYDLTYDLMTTNERMKVQKAIMRNIVKGGYRTYVYNNNVTSNTSNWIAHVVGGALMNIAAIYDDNPELGNVEPYFTGSMIKFYKFINHVTGKDGSWGEGFGYNSYSFRNMSFSIPALNNVFNIDLTKPLVEEYNEYIWSGLIKKRKFFSFGDNSRTQLPALTNWAFLLNMQKNPRLGWFYNFLKKDEAFQDVLYETKEVSRKSAFGEDPDKVFHDIGSTVFKSGWGKDDFSFTMRTGPFYNHQHLDQGSFWLADKGVVFILGKRQGSSYYTDPLYQPSYIQPVSHSTILINHNSQSQRTGDPLHFAPGFDDYAFISNYLDGKNAAFSRGNIGRLYWDKVKSLTRNVLYIKPRTLLLLDIAKPGAKNVDVTELYQTAHLKDIKAGKNLSKITKDGFSLNIMHLAPSVVKAKAVESPHYLNTLLREKPLIKEGMLTVTARTKNKPLVMANLLTTTANVTPKVTSKTGDGAVTGKVSGSKFAFTTKPGDTYHIEDMSTDALAMTWNSDIIFVAMATKLNKKGKLMLKSDTPATVELSADNLKYYRSKAGKFTIGRESKPTSVSLNGKPVQDVVYKNNPKRVIIDSPKGKGTIVIK